MTLLPLLFGAQTVGALVFGPIADLRGRRLAFTFTLLISGAAGCVAAMASSFWMLALFIAIVGFGVGGNMPVDGAIAIEFCPKSLRGRLMTLLTVFWSIGGMLMYGVAWSLIPGHTCTGPPEPCEPNGNRGWRHVMWVVSAICLGSLLPRMGFPESPMWLDARGRTSEARRVVRAVAARNGRVLHEPSVSHRPRLGLALGSGSGLDEPSSSHHPRFKPPSDVSSSAPEAPAAVRAEPLAEQQLAEPLAEPPSSSVAVGKAHLRSGGSWLATPWMKTTLGLLVSLWFLSNFGYGLFSSMSTCVRCACRMLYMYMCLRFLSNFGYGLFSSMSNVTMCMSYVVHVSAVPLQLRVRPLHHMCTMCISRVVYVHVVHAHICTCMCRYGVFNSMTIVLTTAKIGAPPTGDAAYRDAMIQAAAGPAGALLGASLVETRLGRKWSLGMGVILMAVSLSLFLAAHSEAAIVASGAFTQLTAQVMYAALYLYSPEVLPTSVRARGMAVLSGVSRVAGVLAPLTGHGLHMAGLPANGIVSISISCMCTMAICTALLPIETRGRNLS